MPGRLRSTIQSVGFPPPPNAPSLAEQAAISAEVSFPPSPTGPSLCGFSLPGFTVNLSFALPSFPPDFSVPIPNLFFAIPLNCDLADAFPAVSGGGRKPTPPPPDPEFGT